MTRFLLREGDCLDVMKEIRDQSIHAIICDPPYPEIDRSYGRMTEAEWWDMMMGVCTEAKRILKPTGSAVFILQSNSLKVGSMRGWLFEFQAWACREWNMVQDAYWWNISAQPTVHTHRTNGLMRPSLKSCVWLGSPNCYRNQENVLWKAGDWLKNQKLEERALERMPSGFTVRRGRVAETSIERGGVTPFNVIPLSVSSKEGSKYRHGAMTPLLLTEWWVRYICPENGWTLDPFMGTGTTGVVALNNNRRFIGIEKEKNYFENSRERIEEVIQKLG